MNEEQAHTLRDAFKARFPGLVVAGEVRSGRFRFEIWSRSFDGLDHGDRQDQVWAVVDRLMEAGSLPAEADLDISAILCFAAADRFVDFDAVLAEAGIDDSGESTAGQAS